jgi:hypothetical protein
VQVGELYSSCHGNQVHTGRQSVAYHLNARPSAVLNFHDILEEAGHCVPDRHAFQNCIATTCPLVSHNACVVRSQEAFAIVQSQRVIQTLHAARAFFSTRTCFDHVLTPSYCVTKTAAD